MRGENLSGGRSKQTQLKSPRGTFDILPPESAYWERVEGKARELFYLFNYMEIRTPIFEDTALFERSIGKDTDIVAKEMYTFHDRKGRLLTLRPEGTAPIVRAYIEHGMAMKGGLIKLFYMGPFFRYERPQAGRNRQFYQLGAEALGSDSPALDVEVINLSVRFLTSAGISNLKVLLNSTGCPSCRLDYVKKLREYFKPMVDLMCGDCRRRVVSNPLRILDCKKEPCIEVKKNAPRLLDYICGECGEHFSSVKDYLEGSGIEFSLDPFLVRGLDYYTRTSFEIIHHSLGAQNALAGGGRYDCLVREFGGSRTPAVGFACGLERVLSASMKEPAFIGGRKGVSVFAGAVEEKYDKNAFNLVSLLRSEGISCDMDYQRRNLKSQLRIADRMKAGFAVIVSQDFTLRNMETGEQKTLTAGEIVKLLKGK